MKNDFSQKYHKLCAAVSQLKESLTLYGRLDLDEKIKQNIRDSAIQRFEICAELSWKTLRAFQIDQQALVHNSPISVLRQAYSDDMVRDEQAWVDLLRDRNLTSHVYDEATADTIFARIEGSYITLFDRLLADLKDYTQ